jgi:two-component system sensor histidine kinase CpxA
MRSLLIRIFLSFWLIIGITAGVAALSGYFYAERLRDAFESFDYEETMLEASAALEMNGREGLVQWLNDAPSNTDLTIYVIDKDKQDILGRPLPRRVERQLHRHERRMRGHAIDEHVPHNLRRPRPFSQLISPNGEVYTLDVTSVHYPPTLWRGISQRSLLLILALIVSGAISYLLARAIANPIRKLRDATVSLADGNLDVRVGESIGRRRDELGMLASDFDSMANKLSRAAAQQTELSQNISHELRSPLSRMRVALELAKRQAGELSEFDRINVEAERLDSLIGQILSYTRMDSNPQIEAVDIALADLINEVVENVNYECKSDGLSGVTVQSSFDSSPVIRGYADALVSAIENILRNAVRHSPANGTVTVILSHDDSAAKIEVRDQGKGVDDADLLRLFEPFYKTKDAPDSGTGLGLAIAKRAVRLNGGHIAAENLIDGGLQVTVTLPVDKPS